MLQAQLLLHTDKVLVSRYRRDPVHNATHGSAKGISKTTSCYYGYLKAIIAVRLFRPAATEQFLWCGIVDP